jgi:hypothetical protein
VKATPQHKTVGELVALHKEGMLKANPEYQRGVVWSQTQRKKLIDSVLRGYPLPMIYLHHIKKNVAGMQREDLEVIDGQQRIKALFDFSEGAFKLFDPIADEKAAKFPAFIKAEPCGWANSDFHGLDVETKDRFLATSLSVAMIETDSSNEVRDLFVRLQSGLPLNGQETRDAWPGNFTDYILRLGGKPELARYPGHDFFTKTMGLKPGSDRGKTRQLAAQIGVLFFERRAQPHVYVDIKSDVLSEFYYSNLEFDQVSPNALRLIAILNKLSQLLLPGKHAKLRGHDAMHLVLFVDTLLDEYTLAWEDKLAPALDMFMSELAKAKKNKDEDMPDPYWQHYGQWTRVNSDQGDRIAHRHKFYVEKMLGFMAPLSLKDPTRLYGEVERTILFHRQHKLCAVCGSSLDWRTCEVHHVEEHSKGGVTSLDNGAVVHKECHPKGAVATKAFAAKFAESKLDETSDADAITKAFLLENASDQ